MLFLKVLSLVSFHKATALIKGFGRRAYCIKKKRKD